jgi:TfoX/Sxy family transcriptional regulator of competence genes
MAYDEALADRVRGVIGDDPRLSERKMFGGLCLMVSGHMCVGIVGDELIVRVGPDGYPDALAQAHAREMDFTGKPMKSMVYVRPKGYESDADLERWVETAVRFAKTLPAK